MSTHPRITVEGLDPFMWIAARWMGIDSETARAAVERYSDDDSYTNGDREEDTEAGVNRRDAEADFYTEGG